MVLGFQVLDRHRTVPRELVELARDIPVANISDCMSRMSAGGAGLALLNTDLGTRMAGPALTVKTRPGDNLMVHKAISMIEPGDVLVVDAGGDLTNAIVGEIMVAAAVAKEVAGLVVHGAVRDAATLRAGDLPVFASGVTHRGPYKDGPGEVNVPVSLGGMVVEPGDLVVGDADGVLSIPFAVVRDVLDAARAKSDHEAVAIRRAAAGERDETWIDRRLAEQGYRAPAPAP